MRKTMRCCSAAVDASVWRRSMTWAARCSTRRCQDKRILALNIGSTCRLRDIHRHHWEKLLHSMRVNVDAALARITAMATALPDYASDLAHAMGDEGFGHPILELLPFLLAESSMKKLRKLLVSTAANNPI